MTGRWGSHWNGLSLDRLIKVLEPYEPRVGDYRNRIRMFPARADFYRRLLIRKCIERKLDPDDPFHPHPRPDQLGSAGLEIGQAEPGIGTFRYDEPETGILFAGSPKSGKTTAIRHVVRQAHASGIGVLWPDVRGDAFELLGSSPGALAIPADEDRISLFRPPPGMSAILWAHVVVARLTLDLALQQASQGYLIRLVTRLVNEFAAKGAILTLPDLRDELRKEKPRPRSSAEGYWERVSDRVQTVLDLAGEDTFAVQEGFPVIEEIEQGNLVIQDLRVDKMLADLLTSLRLYWLYYKRLHSDDPFNQKTVLVVLDEMRSLIRRQSHEFGIPDVELLFSRARALRIGFLVGEQVVSAVSPAVLTALRLKLAFNTSNPELFHVARLLGLDPTQAEELQKLSAGHCIARHAGDRLPFPFRLLIPSPGA